MKEELISLAKEKGFKSNILAFNLDLLISSDGHEINRLCYYLWLCELQKWLREEYNVIVDINPETEDNFSFYFIGGGFVSNGRSKDYNTYEEALEKGSFKALELIKCKTTLKTK